MSSDDDRAQLRALLTEARPLRDLGKSYERGRARIVGLVSDLDAAAARTPVPACPDWTIHDVLAHLTGICADVLAGNIDGAGTDDWTGAQVAARADDTLVDLLAEWDDVGPLFATLLDDFPGRVCSQPVADLAVHEHDIRGAVSRPGARDSDGVSIGLDFLVEVFLQPGVAALGLDPIEICAGEHRWVAGSDGATPVDLEEAWQSALRSAEPNDVGPRSPAGGLRVDPFELFRAVSGRRSAAQIRRFDWTVDPEPYLPVFGFGPFTVRDADLVE